MNIIAELLAPFVRCELCGEALTGDLFNQSAEMCDGCVNDLAQRYAMRIQDLAGGPIDDLP